MKLKSPKVYLVILGILLSLTCFFFSLRIVSLVWRTYLINLSTTFLSLALGVLAVNLYLEGHKKRSAVISLLQLSNDEIASFHNNLLDVFLGVFGAEEFASIVKIYIGSNGMIHAIRPQDRSQMYEAVSKHSSVIKPHIDALSQTLSDLIFLVGWDLDASLLAGALSAKHSMKSLLKLDLKDAAKADDICEHIIDLEIHTQSVRNQLLKIAGITEDD